MSAGVCWTTLKRTGAVTASGVTAPAVTRWSAGSALPTLSLATNVDPSTITADCTVGVADSDVATAIVDGALGDAVATLRMSFVPSTQAAVAPSGESMLERGLVAPADERVCIVPAGK